MTVIMSQTQTAAVTTRHRTGLQLFRFILQPIAVDKLSGNCAKPITWSRGHKSRFKKKQAELVCLVRTVWTPSFGQYHCSQKLSISQENWHSYNEWPGDYRFESCKILRKLWDQKRPASILCDFLKNAASQVGLPVST